MELICTQEEMLLLQKAVKSNKKVSNLLATLREFDLIAEDISGGIITLHRDAIPTMIERSVE